MLASHWLKAIAIILYFAATAFVLNRCDRLLAPADSPKKVEALISREQAQPGKEKAPTVLSEHAKLRAEQRKAHADALAQTRARQTALEADLAEIIEKDLPAALAELAQVAIRYRNKLPDLKRLTKAQQWERETPVIDAHARARGLTEEWHKFELEAQKEREGPTLHLAPDIDALKKRLAEFKRGGEEIDAFAASLAALYGKVPESLLLAAIDAIPRAVLPKDAFDPCRDPAACPKPAAVERFMPATGTAMSVRDFAAGVRLCIDAGAVAGQAVPLRPQPDFTIPAPVSILPHSCRLRATGRHIDRTNSGGSLWVEVIHDSGRVGWLQAYTLRRERSW